MGDKYGSALHREMATQIVCELSRTNTTQKTLAIRCDLSEKHVSQMLTGKIEGSWTMWHRMAAAMGKRWEIRLV